MSSFLSSIYIIFPPYVHCKSQYSGITDMQAYNIYKTHHKQPIEIECLSHNNIIVL